MNRRLLRVREKQRGNGREAAGCSDCSSSSSSKGRRERDRMQDQRADMWFKQSPLSLPLTPSHSFRGMQSVGEQSGTDNTVLSQREKGNEERGSKGTEAVAGKPDPAARHSDRQTHT